MHAAVNGFVHVLGPVVDDLWVVRVDLDRRLAHEPISHVLRVLAVALLRIDPVVLFLPGFDVVAAELPLAVTIDDPAVGRRPNLAALAT